MRSGFKHEKKNPSDWSDTDIYELLCRIDEGYEPDEAETAALENRIELFLWNTNITVLPESIGRLTALRRLVLWLTGITALPESIGRLTALQELYLNRTQITALPDSMKHLTALRVLWLGGTGITALPDWIGRLPALENLGLDGLTLPRIPESLAKRGLLFSERAITSDKKAVSLWHTTLTEQDISVFLENDPKLIADLYRRDELLTLRECRVIFLGDGDSGKSYTIQRFRSDGKKETEDNPYPTRETPGVEILDQRVQYGGEDLTLHFWDFGGQQLLHAMHRCFLTEETCYVVTVKSRETKATQRARYWLRNVTAFAPKSPILLYVNCWDNDDGSRSLDETPLLADFPNIQKVVRVSAKEAEDGEFRTKLMEPLLEMAARSEGCGKPVNRRWDAVRRSIEAESQEKPYLTKARYHRLCADNGIENETAPALLAFFNNLGVCFSYHRDEEKKELADYRLLRPVWLTNALYAIIEEGTAYAEEGRISDDAIRQMLCNPAPTQVRGRGYRRTVPDIVYREEECGYIIDVAVLHKLCYRLQTDRDKLFFPALCPAKTPEAALEAPAPGLRRVEYRLKYDYLPDSVVHRLMIRCMRRHYDVQPCWLRGMVLTDTEEHRAVVRMSDDEDELLRITLWAPPEKPAYDFFLRLRREILEVNAELGLGAAESIADGDDSFPLLDLLEAMRDEDNPKHIVYAGGKKRSAAELLGAVYEPELLSVIQVRENNIVIPILPREYHPCKKENQALRRALFETYNRTCPICKLPLANLREFDVDHILPSAFQKRKKQGREEPKPGEEWLDVGELRPDLREYIRFLNARGFDTRRPDYVENYLPVHHSCNIDRSDFVADVFALISRHELAARHAEKVLKLMEESQSRRDD